MPYVPRPKDINFIGWIPYLTGGDGEQCLLGKMDNMDLNYQIVVRRDRVKENSNKNKKKRNDYKEDGTFIERTFASFENSVAFYSYLEYHIKTNQGPPCFHEIILANRLLKMYFDIDINDPKSCKHTYDEVVTLVINAFIQIMKEIKDKGFKFNVARDVRNHTSHGLKNGRQKLSGLIVGGDELHGRNPHKDELIFHPLFPIIFLGNIFPLIKNPVLWEKLVLVVLTTKFVNNPKAPNEIKKIPNYDKELMKDREFMEAFLYLLVEGAIQFNKNGQSVEWDHELPREIKNRRKGTNTLDSFLEEECETDYADKREEIRIRIAKENGFEEDEIDDEMEEKIDTEMLYFSVDPKSDKRIERSEFNRAYNFYRADFKEPELTPQQIGEKMREKGYIPYKSGNFIYKGIELKKKRKQIS